MIHQIIPERRVKEVEEQQEVKQRKMRSDAGKRPLSERDIWALTWIGDMWGVQNDQLERLLARKVIRKDKLKSEDATAIATRTVIPRWKELGLVEYGKIIANKPAWIWLTKKGLALLELPYTYVEPKPGKVQHYYWCNETRLYVEAQPIFAEQNRVWLSERKQKFGREGRKRWLEHPTDATVVALDYPEYDIAVEVEVTAKSKERTLEIMKALLRRYPNAWYFVSPEAKGVVEWAISQLTSTGKEAIQLFDLHNLE